MDKSKFNINWLFLGIPVMFIIAIVVFLSTKDCAGVYCITGWETLKLQWPSFWIWVTICTLLGIACAWFSYQTEKQGGSTGRVILLAILALLLICTPWGKACTDKTNGGVTAPGFNNGAKPTSYILNPEKEPSSFCPSLVSVQYGDVMLLIDDNNIFRGDNIKLVKFFSRGGSHKDMFFRVKFDKPIKYNGSDYRANPITDFMIYDFKVRPKGLAL